MALMVNGKKVLGYAIGGNEFYSLDKNADGSINIGGHLNENKMRIKGTNSFNLGLSDYKDSNTIDVTSKLSNSVGCLAIYVIGMAGGMGNYVYSDFTLSQPIIIPTAPTTENLSFDDDSWSGSLSRTTENNFTLDLSCNEGYKANGAIGEFYILSNDAS